MPRPQGPIERWTDRLGPGALLGAGAVLGLTRDPGRAADTILVAVPKAARRGREGFATMVGRELARRGVVPLNAAAWRRLDRISAIVLDSPLLCADHPEILAVEPGANADAAQVWRDAGRVLDGRSWNELSGRGPWRRDGLRLERDRRPDEPGAVHLVLRHGADRRGGVVVGRQLDPLADALLDAARATGAQVLLTPHASAADLIPRADEVLPGDQPLAASVQRLQREGHGVLVASVADDQALAVADVGVAVLGSDARLCWSADLLSGPGLEGLWRILRAVGAARPVSERAVQYAQAGSALGALVALVGGRRQRTSRVMQPVYGAALVALVHGTIAGLVATRQRAPASVAHVPWHALDALDVLARLDAGRVEAEQETGPGWLPSAAQRVRALANRIPGSSRAAGPAGAMLRLAGAFREELQDPLTPVLAVGAAASAAVPEGLPLVATVAQAASARRLSHKGVLVRSSRTLEGLGRVDVVCFDKTGTLTEGRLAVTRMASADADLTDEEPYLRRLLIAAARACPSVQQSNIASVPHATDRAVLEAASRSSGMDHRKGWRLRAELPFGRPEPRADRPAGHRGARPGHGRLRQEPDG